MGRNCEIKEKRMAKKFNYEDIIVTYGTLSDNQEN